MKRRAAAIFWFMVAVFAVLALGLFLLHQAEKRAGGNVLGRTAGAVESAVTPRAASMASAAA